MWWLFTRRRLHLQRMKLVAQSATLMWPVNLFTHPGGTTNLEIKFVKEKKS